MDNDATPVRTPAPTGVHQAGATQLLTSPHLRRFMVVRHQLEAVAARIAADCERMLRLAMHPDRAAWRGPVGEALLASRQVTFLTQAPPPTTEEQAEERLAELEGGTRTSLDQVVSAMSALMRMKPVTVHDELLVADARVVSGMAATAFATASGQFRAVTAPSQPERAAPPSDDRSAARILVVDDDPDLRDMLARMLRRLGYEVVVAQNGRAGLEAAQKEPVDLVLTDMNMPEMDGITLLKTLKDLPSLRDIPVVVISSEGDLTHVIHSIELGAEDHIQKPFQATLLQARVRACLLRKRMRDRELDHLKRVDDLTDAADAVDREKYVPGSLHELTRGSDALANLARVFERLVLNMRSREERMSNRLRQLRSEVQTVGSPVALATSTTEKDGPFASGQTVAGRYTILGRLGKGGMGTVYHAKDLDLNEEIAIKVVRGELVESDPTIISRFKSEIRLARRLSHLNILRAHDLGEAEGTHFITMEYVRGVTVADILDQRGRLAVDTVLAIGAQLADALAVAHSHEIIHRDIKPANLLMNEAGVLKVMDFGLAKVIANETGNTRGGFIVGTPNYMAPEQLMNGALDARTDLFAVGVVLYECLCGQTPFRGESPVTIATRMIDGNYDRLSKLVPRIPPRLEAIVDSLLSLEPSGRIQTATEVSHRLAEIEGAHAA